MSEVTVDTKKLRELAEAATPGEWEHCYYDGPGSKGWCVDREPECDDAPLRPVMTEADARLIAAMRNALPELLDAYEKWDEHGLSLDTKIAMYYVELNEELKRAQARIAAALELLERDNWIPAMGAGASEAFRSVIRAALTGED